MAVEGLGPKGPRRTPTTPTPPLTPELAPVGRELPPAAIDHTRVSQAPLTLEERQAAVVAAARRAQAEAEGLAPPPVTKTAADALGVADGVRTGVKIATNLDEVKALPVVGKLAQRSGRVGALFSFLPASRIGQWLGTVLESHRFIAPASRFLGRVAPIAGVVVGGYDVWDATRTQANPKATSLEKGVAIAKAACSSLAGVAGVAALVLAPTGIGAAIAGGISVGAGLLALGADVMLGRLRKVRQQREKL